LINLLSNAVKFTNVGVVKVSALVIESDDNTVTIGFEVRDSGIGMTREQIKVVFEPFVQGEVSTTREYGGTGLGLNITQKIVDLMGGRLMVESTPGIGSKFSFVIPFQMVDVAVDDVGQPSIPDLEEKPTFAGEVLVCEDNHMNQQVISEHLEKVGLNAVIAQNGKFGVEMVRDRISSGKKPFDLIFMDIHMPVMDGLEATSHIIELNTGTPIVALTANVMSNDMDVYKQSGMNDCLGKPFTSQELWRRLLKYLKPIGWQNVGADANEGDGLLLKKLRAQFLRNNRNKFTEIKDLINAGEISSAHRAAHTLKSTAGLIGEPGLQNAASDLESLLKDDVNKATKKELDILESELNNVINKLGALPGEDEIQTENKGHTGDVVTDKILALYKEIEPMLRQGNTKCLAYIEGLSAIPDNEELIRQMEDYDLDKAAVTLKQKIIELEGPI